MIYQALPLDGAWKMKYSEETYTPSTCPDFEGIFVDHVHRKGGDGGFIQTNLKGLSWKPPISNCEFVRKQTE